VGIVLASSGTAGSPASAAEAATVYIVSGELAAALESQNKSVRSVLRGEAGDEPVVIVFGPTLETATALADELFSTDPVENCDEGVECCLPTKGVMVVNAIYNGQNGWMKTGEPCDPQGIEEVRLKQVSAWVSNELKRISGMDSCLMQTTDENGNPLLLVNGSVEGCLSGQGEGHSDAAGALPTMARAPAQDGALWLTSFITRRALPEATSPIILASHCPSQPPAACPGTQTSTKLCARADDYWYKKTDQGVWCKVSRCSRC
jgi:hypothetical protein